MSATYTQSAGAKTAGSDAHGGRTSGEDRSPHLQAVTDALASAIARINELEHRIYVLEAKHNQEGETQ